MKCSASNISQLQDWPIQHLPGVLPFLLSSHLLVDADNLRGSVVSKQKKPVSLNDREEGCLVTRNICIGLYKSKKYISPELRCQDLEGGGERGTWFFIKQLLLQLELSIPKTGLVPFEMFPTPH